MSYSWSTPLTPGGSNNTTTTYPLAASSANLVPSSIGSGMLLSLTICCKLPRENSSDTMNKLPGWEQQPMQCTMFSWRNTLQEKCISSCRVGVVRWSQYRCDAMRCMSGYVPHQGHLTSELGLIERNTFLVELFDGNLLAAPCAFPHYATDTLADDLDTLHLIGIDLGLHVNLAALHQRHELWHELPAALLDDLLDAVLWMPRMLRCEEHHRYQPSSRARTGVPLPARLASKIAAERWRSAADWSRRSEINLSIPESPITLTMILFVSLEFKSLERERERERERASIRFKDIQWHLCKCLNDVCCRLDITSIQGGTEWIQSTDRLDRVSALLCSTRRLISATTNRYWNRQAHAYRRLRASR